MSASRWVLAGLVVAAAGCGSDHAPRPAGRVLARPVLTEQPAACTTPDGVAALKGQRCFTLGEPTVVIEGDGKAGGSAVSVKLTKGASQAMDDLAASCVGAQPACPLGEVAIVRSTPAGTFVVSAPSIDVSSFGGGLTISGELDEAGARDLVALLRPGA